MSLTPRKRSAQCPRCQSKRVMDRIDGGKFCRRCGQRWKGPTLIQSADKRERDGKTQASQYAFPSF